VPLIVSINTVFKVVVSQPISNSETGIPTVFCCNGTICSGAHCLSTAKHSTNATTKDD